MYEYVLNLQMFLSKTAPNTYRAIYNEDISKDNEIKIGSVGRWTKSSLRSIEQNRGYWAVIIPQIIRQLDARGTQFPIGFEKEDVVHGLLHKLFLTAEFMGKEITISTAKLSKDQTSEYWERISLWYAETFQEELIMPKK